MRGVIVAVAVSTMFEDVQNGEYNMEDGEGANNYILQVPSIAHSNL